MEEQRRVLMKRRGSVVGRRSILKSYGLPAAAQLGAGRGGSPLAVEGVSDIRRAFVRVPPCRLPRGRWAAKPPRAAGGS